MNRVFDIEIDSQKFHLFPVRSVEDIEIYYAAETVYNGTRFVLRLKPDDSGNWKIYHPTNVPEGIKAIEDELHRAIATTGFMQS